MKILIYIIRVPFAIVLGLGMMAFIPLAGMIFAPAGMLWALSGLSLLSPLISWIFKEEDFEFLDMAWKERLMFFTMPIWAPMNYAYRIVMFGEIMPDKLGFEK